MGRELYDRYTLSSKETIDQASQFWVMTFIELIDKEETKLNQTLAIRNQLF